MVSALQTPKYYCRHTTSSRNEIIKKKKKTISELFKLIGLGISLETVCLCVCERCKPPRILLRNIMRIRSSRQLTGSTYIAIAVFNSSFAAFKALMPCLIRSIFCFNMTEEYKKINKIWRNTKQSGIAETESLVHETIPLHRNGNDMGLFVSYQQSTSYYYL